VRCPFPSSILILWYLLTYFSLLQHRNVEIWQDVLEIRSLVLSPLEDRQNWLRFAR